MPDEKPTKQTFTRSQRGSGTAASSNGEPARKAYSSPGDTGEAASPAGPPARPSPSGRQRPPFEFKPLATYKGMIRRFFIVVRHVFGLLAGGLVAYVNALPPERKHAFRSAGSRTAAFLVRPFVLRKLRRRPFAIQLRRRLEMLGPTYVKLGQIMSIREDLLPKHITNELDTLLDRLPPISFTQVRAIIERSLERPLDVLFRRINVEPLASASIAQVHRAETMQGDEVVVKVIKPGIIDTIRSDLKLLRLVGTFLQWIFPRYQPRRIIEEFSAYTNREVDLNYEADNAETFAANFQDMPEIKFPGIHRELSSDEVLTMEFLDGLKPTSATALALDETDHERIIDLGADAIIRMLFKDGFFHADLHPGNLLVLPATEDAPLRIGFIDLGMAGRFEEKTKRQLLYYFRALVNDDIEEATRYLTALATVREGGDPQGFRRAAADLSRRFTMRYASGQLSLAQLILESLNLGGKYRVFFPVEMTLMVKALITFEGLGRALEPQLDIPKISQKHVARIFADRFNPASVARELYRDLPEMLDIMMRLPPLLTSGMNFMEESLNDRPRRRRPVDLHNSIIAATCILGGVLAILQGGPLILWLLLLTVGFSLAAFGK